MSQIVENVYCFETGILYKTSLEAANEYNIPLVKIERAINQSTLTAGNVHWYTNIKLFNTYNIRSRGARIIYCYETREQFTSLREAGKAYDISPTSIAGVINLHNRTRKQLHWCTSLSVFDNITLVYPKFGTSIAEKEVLDYIKSLTTVSIKENYRGLIKPQEIDIFIPSISLAIEFNGDYWHNDTQKLVDYHKLKTYACIYNNIQLIHIFEHQWKYKQQIVKAILRRSISNNILKLNPASCSITTITTKLCNQIIANNSLYCNLADSELCIGLYDDKTNTLLHVISLTRMYDNSWFINNQCSNSLTYTYNSLEILLDKFIIQYTPTSLTISIDLRFEAPTLYDNLGFIYEVYNEPISVWVKNSLILNELTIDYNILPTRYDYNETFELNMRRLKFNRIL